MNTMKLALFPLVAITVAACASTPVPADKYARSQSAIRTAEEMNAASDPGAALHLKLAKEQLEAAKSLMKDGDNENAKIVLLRAEADGEAAFNIARAHAAQLEAKKTIQSIQQAMTDAQKGSGT